MRDYVAALRRHLPRGKIWEAFYDSNFYKLLEGIAVEFGRVDARAEQLLLEMDPQTTTELIEDWERTVGLPDPCAPTPTTIEERRAAVTARWIARGGWSGGPSVPFMQTVAAALGYALEVRRFMYQAQSCEGDCTELGNPDDPEGWIFVWEFVALHGVLDSYLQCQIERYALGALGLSFAFPLIDLTDATFTRASTAILSNPITGVTSLLASGELGEAFVFGTNLDI